MTHDQIILHEDGTFRLYSNNKTMSILAHRCKGCPIPTKFQWWFLPSPYCCYMCGAVPSDKILGLYMLHNWDRLQAVK